MAISQNPITGRMRQKMSNVVFSTVFSQNVVRSKPLTVRNPKTTAQVNHRDYFTKCVETSKIFMSDAGVAKRSSRTGRNPKMSGYSYMVKGLMNAEVRTTTPYSTDWSSVDLGPGEIGNVAVTGTVASGTLTLSWNPDILPPNAKYGDKIHLALFDEANKQYAIVPIDQAREDGTCNCILGNYMEFPAHKMVVIFFFHKEDWSMWSAEPAFFIND